MGFFSEELMPMLETYQMETNDLMGIFSRLVLTGEQNNGFTEDEINEIFRTAHTIKSASAMMGLTELSTITHRMEDLFSIYRDEPGRIQGRVTDIADLLYDYEDYVKNEISRMGNEDFEPRSNAALQRALSKEISNYDHVEASANQTAVVRKMPEAQAVQLVWNAGKTHSIRILFEENCAMVNVRALVILKQLQQLCDVVSYEPCDLNADDASNLIHTQGLLVVFNTLDEQAVLDKLEHNSYVRMVEKISDEKAVPDELEDEPEENQVSDEPQEELKTEAFTTYENEKYISVHWHDILSLQNLAGEFLLNQSFLNKLMNDFSYSLELDRFAAAYAHLLDELVHRTHVMSMLSFSMLMPQFYRVVREICREEKKEVSFKVIGENIEIDRNLFDNISKPLLHIIRNSIDHGIETPDVRKQLNKPRKGLVTLTLENQGNRIVFSISDDGKGMDAKTLLKKAEEKGLLTKASEEYTKEEALQLIMLPGFTTKDKVTNISGRGVGMDVVNTVAASFGGSVTIDSELGKGSSIAMYMPVSVTAVDSLAFSVDGLHYFLPLFNIDKVYDHREAQQYVSEEGSDTCFDYDKHTLPVLYLRDVYQVNRCHENSYIVLHSLGHRFCLIVDTVDDQVQAIEKNMPVCLDEEYQKMTGICNCVILHDGTIGYTLNANSLYTICRKEGTDGRNKC